MLIRDATVADAEAIARIYNREVLESTHTFDLVERTLDEQRSYIRDRSGVLAVLVADAGDPDGVVGFGALSFYRDRPGYRTSVENSIYVDPAHQRRGIGDQLLGALVDRARRNGFHAVFARIVDAQDASLQLHLRHGYDLVGIEREAGRKFGRWLDVALLQRLL